MKLAILSRAPKAYTTQRLKKAALDRGHTCKVLDTLRFAIDLSHGEPDLQFRSKPLSDYDAILPRIGASVTYFGSALVRQFEQMDIYTPNTATGIMNSRDKLRAIQILSRHDIGLPATAFVRDRADVLPAIDRVGGAPVVIKLLEGTQGKGVVLAETRNAAESVIEAFRGLNANILVQEFIKEAGGADVRCFVVGEKVVASMMRQGKEGEFRSNLHKGGSANLIKITPEERSTAVRAAKVMGLNIAGVDLLRSNHGPVIMEVNSSPGLEGIETASGKDVGGAIIQFIENNAAAGKTRTRGKG